MFAELLDMVGKLPAEVGLRMLDLVVEMSDLPNKEEMVKRIRDLTGMDDPDMEEDDEAMQAKAEQEEQQAQIQARTTEAELRYKEAGAAKKEADALWSQMRAQNEQAKTQVLQMQAVDKAMGEKLEAFTKALEVAQRLQENPVLGAAADEIIRDANPNKEPNDG